MSRPRRYAEWRPVAVRRMPAQWIGLLTGASVGTVLAVVWHNPSQIVYWIAAGLAAFVTNRVADRRLQELRDEGTNSQFAVTLRLERETTYGHDEGLVSFEDGYLIYMGRRCVFSVGARDVKVTTVGRADLRFDFAGPGGKHSAHIQLRKSGVFDRKASEWFQARRRSRDSVLPPIVPDPQGSRVLMAAMSVVVFVVLGLAIAAIDSPELTERNLPIIAGSALLGFSLLLALYRYVALGWIAQGERRSTSLKRRWKRSRGRRDVLPDAEPVSVASGVEESVEVRVRA